MSTPNKKAQKKQNGKKRSNDSPVTTEATTAPALQETPPASSIVDDSAVNISLVELPAETGVTLNNPSGNVTSLCLTSVTSPLTPLLSTYHPPSQTILLIHSNKVKLTIF